MKRTDIKEDIRPIRLWLEHITEAYIMHYETRKANAYVMEGFTGEVALSWTLHRILKTNEGRAFQKNEKKRNSRNESKEA